MPLGTNHNSATTLAPFIPEIWGQKINDYYRANLTMASFFVDRSDEMVEGGDTLHTPNLTAMGANDKANGSQVTLNAATETSVDLLVNTWKEVSFLIEDKETAQMKRSYQLQDRKARDAGYEAAAALENAIAALFSGFSQTVGASGTDISDDEIREAIATLSAANVTGMRQDQSVDQEVAFFFHPTVFWRQVQELDRFALAQNSPVNDPTAKRPAAFLYGIPVYLSTNVPVVSTDPDTGRRNLLANKDALHWASSPLPRSSMSQFIGTEGVRVQTNYIPEYLGWLTTADVVFGVIENRDNAAVQLLTHISHT